MKMLANPSKWSAFLILVTLLTLGNAATQAATTTVDEHGWQIMNGPSDARYLASLNAPADENWASNFTLNGTNDEVLALVTDGNSNLYAGGRFTTAGNVMANYIAKWDGSNWSPLGNGVSGAPTDTSVWSLAVDGSNNLYAGGRFAFAGGIAANNIAKWDGTSWRPLGGGVTGCNPSPYGCYPVVSALAIDHNGNVYAGGNFLTAGGVTVNGIAKWNGNSWQALGSGVSGGWAWVRALLLDDSGNLFVGGNFVTAGGITVNNVAKWNGSTWQPLGSGSSGGDPDILAFALDGSGSLYAAGGFTSIGGVSASRVAKWNGSSWEAVSSPIPPAGAAFCEISAVAFHGSTLYVAGDFNSTSCFSSQEYIAAWNGSSWSTLDSGTNGPISALAVDGSGNLYAGGVFGRVVVGATGLVSRVAKWNGTSWAGLGVDNSVNSGVRALAVSGGDIYVGGDFGWADTVRTSAIAKWNGGSWSTVGTGSGMTGVYNYGSVAAFARDGSGNVYAGGTFTTADGASANNIAKWTGSYWEALGSGIDGQVDALAIDSNGNLYAGGFFTSAGGVSANCVAKWDGSNWAAMGSGVSCGPLTKGGRYFVSSVVVDGNGNVYVGGFFPIAGNVTANHVAKWNVSTSSWSALGGGMETEVSALATDGAGNLYAGGWFTSAGGVTANHIAKWNGSSWSALGNGMDGTVSALALDGGGNLYAGGGFNTAGGVAANNIAKWNGSTWRALGSGISGINRLVLGLAIDGSGNLYAGGIFDVAGGKPSAYFARCTIAPSVSDFFKLDDKNKRASFSAAEFASHFTEVDGSTLAKIKILSLPSHGALALGASNVSVNQEINVADLGSLSFTPETDWLGTTNFGWSGSDGNQYAPTGASVNMIVAVLKYLNFPLISR